MSGEEEKRKSFKDFLGRISAEDREKLQAYLEKMKRTPVEIPAELREEWRVVAERYDERHAEMMQGFWDLEMEAREAKRAKERKEDWRYRLALGVTIVIAIVGWFREWLLAIIQKVLGG